MSDTTNGPTPVLDLSVLTKMEAATLTYTLRNALLDIEQSTEWVPAGLWAEITRLYLEARMDFIRKFFEVGT